MEVSSSDSDDEEYIPEGDPSSPDESEGEAEEGVRVMARARGGGRKGRVKKMKTRRKKNTKETSRRRKGGIRLEEEGQQDKLETGQEVGSCDTETKSHDDDDDDDDDDGDGDGVDVTGEEGERGEGGEREEEEAERSRIDDLWASFKQETGFKTKTSAKPAEPKPETVTIRKAYDFAGEEVVVEEEVAVDSKEARAFQQSQVRPPEGGAVVMTTPTATPTATSSKPSEMSLAASPVVTGVKRASSLSSVLQSLNKKPKMSTLEKSHIDWVHYRKEAGLEEELAQQNKDGYLERQAFLHRADVRQFELEREERLKRFRRLQ